jgi:hypothetical protein
MVPDEWGSSKTQVLTQEDKDRAEFLEEERQRDLELRREVEELQAVYAEKKKRKECNWFAGIPLWARPAYMNLSDAGKRLIVCLGFYRNKKTGLAFPGMATIMKDTKLPRRTVFRAFKEVAEAGLIEKSEGLDGMAFRGHSPKWAVFNPETMGKAGKGAIE